MGKTVTAAVNTVANIPRTVGLATVDTAKSLTGQNKGNYLKNLAETGVNDLVTGGSYGLTSTKDLGGNNNIDAQIGRVVNKRAAAGADITPPTAPEALAPGAAVPIDPALQAEMDNSRKKGRASTVLGGGVDVLGSTSAKKSLLGGL